MAEEDKKTVEATEEPIEDAEAQEEDMPSGDEPSDSEPEEAAEPAVSPFARLKSFLEETNKFLGGFDDLVEGRDKHKSIYLCTVNELRELLVALLHRYILHTMVREDFLYKHIKCCGESEELLNTEEFDEHYQEAHKDADKAITLPELAAIQEYTQAVKEYIELGKAMNNDLIFSLKRLLRKSNTVLAGHLG
ncbi:uncharacterized protein LOC131284814 [Anopheles ziemanni]|uniref:uncharacterized protein LOC131261794 n=1 Tax=Anopheles coustani TaxID=139045 RepID=UPI00265A5BE0|nr:uncharacterized protein LOC131261794 [Anopheles coustani]XP_058169657.1 uncharacterized protein LOC131284814 [Anopheles ziemanni]